MAKGKLRHIDRTAELGFEDKLRITADKLRNSMDAGEHKHVVSGPIILSDCGSDGMFVQSEKFVETHGNKLGDISIYGRESNSTTHRLAIMNIAIRGIEADSGPKYTDTFRHDPLLDDVLAAPLQRLRLATLGRRRALLVRGPYHRQRQFRLSAAPHGIAGFVLTNSGMCSHENEPS